jgi:hypothetical protein
MDRRQFLRWSALGLGAAAALPLVRSRVLAAAPPRADYKGPLLITIHASGGWDPIFLTDPKPVVELNRVTQSVGTVGNISFADHAFDPLAFGFEASAADHILDNRGFFTRHGSRVTVLNGVDTRTNNHDTGTRYVWSGRSEIGYPALAAVVASNSGNSEPLSFISAGGYDHVYDLVPLSRTGDVGTMKKLMDPNARNVDRPDTEFYHAPHALGRLKAARAARLEAQLEAATYPNVMQGLRDYRAGLEGIDELADFPVPESLVTLPGNALAGLQRVQRTIQLGISGMKAGLTVSTSVSVGGFDTHGDHDRNHPPRLYQVLSAMAYAIEEAERAGLADRVWVVAGSDFGRGPFYNGTAAASGKDHWAPTTMLVAVPTALAPTWGNRVIGGTNDSVRARKVSTTTLSVDDNGIVMSPKNIHRALRRAMSLEGGVADRRFPLGSDELPLWR